MALKSINYDFLCTFENVKAIYGMKDSTFTQRVKGELFPSGLEADRG